MILRSADYSFKQKTVPGDNTAVRSILDAVEDDTEEAAIDIENIKTVTGNPGQICSFNKDGMIVCCQKGAINLKSVQFPGKKVISSNDFFNSKRDIIPLKENLILFQVLLINLNLKITLKELQLDQENQSCLQNLIITNVFLVCQAIPFPQLPVLDFL